MPPEERAAAATAVEEKPPSKPLSEMTDDEKKAAKAAAIAAAKAAAKAKLEASRAAAATAVEEKPPTKPLSEMTDDEKKAAKAAAIAAAKAAAKAKLEAGGAASVTDAGADKANAIAAAKAKAAAAIKAKGEQAKQGTPPSEKEARAKRISKKMAISVIFFVSVILASGSALGMKLLVWNDYDDGTQLEKQYRANIQKLKENPENLEVRYELLAAMYRKNLHEEAKTQLQYILEHAPKDSEIRVNSIYYKGLYDSLAGKSEEAIDDYQQYLKANPGNGEAWLNLSYLCYQIGNYEESANAVGKAGVLLPGLPDVPYLQGMLLLKSEQKKAAAVMFEKALERDSSHQKSINMLKQLEEKGEN